MIYQILSVQSEYFVLLLIGFLLFIRRIIYQKKKNKHRNENDRGQRIHFRLDSLFDFRINFGRQGIDSCTLGKRF